MAYWDAQMDGARDFILRLHINLNWSDQPSNTSSVSWYLECIDVANWGSYGNYSTPWSVWIEGNNYTGNIGSFDPTMGIASGNTTVTHDANGYMTVDGSGWWNSSHSNIGQATVYGAYGIARLPKVPSAPTPVGLTEITASSMKYQFSGNDDGGSGILEWQFEYDDNNSFTSPTAVGSSGTTTVTGLPGGTTQYFRSRGRNAIGWGPWSSTISATTLGGAPSVPQSVGATATPPGTIGMTWTAPSSNGGKAITGYDAQISVDASMNTSITTQNLGVVLSATFNGRTPGVMHYVRVRAKNVDADGAWSTPVGILLPAGGKVWTGTDWKSSVFKVWTGAIWKTAIVKVWTGSIWKVSK